MRTRPAHLAQSNGGTHLQQQVDVAHTPAKSILDEQDSGSVMRGNGSSPGLWLWPGQPGAGRQALQQCWAQQQALQRGWAHQQAQAPQAQRWERQLGVAQLQSREGIHQQVETWRLVATEDTTAVPRFPLVQLVICAGCACWSVRVGFGELSR